MTQRRALPYRTSRRFSAMVVDWYKLELSLETFDESRFVPVLEACLETGIRFSNFAAVGGSDGERRLYELNRACSRDIPNRGEFYTFEEYVAERIDDPAFVAEGVVIALHEDEWIGMCALSSGK